ncbi:hypothetical protein [Spiroplasma endosymbiont of 'Nebria riversi']|uniref:hypothetical protein n=1 Tax=Spiroplasma endosymbiont of 'Nebria riversi' TaxID=2792084 RepID=UPI001C05503E|nr:hypothetical protein [Spiroplasma endosymbiont of 'Nebria riversi']
MFKIKLVSIKRKVFKNKDCSVMSGYSDEFLRYENDLFEPTGEQKALWIDDNNLEQQEIYKLLKENVKSFFSCELTFDKNPKIVNLQKIELSKN